MAEAAATQVTLQKSSGNSAGARFAGFIVTLAKRKPMGFISLWILVFMLIVALVPQVFATHDPAETGVGERPQNYCPGPKDTFLCPTKYERSQIAGEGLERVGRFGSAAMRVLKGLMRKQIWSLWVSEPIRGVEGNQVPISGQIVARTGP